MHGQGRKQVAHLHGGGFAVGVGQVGQQRLDGPVRRPQREHPAGGGGQRVRRILFDELQTLQGERPDARVRVGRGLAEQRRRAQAHGDEVGGRLLADVGRYVVELLDEGKGVVALGVGQGPRLELVEQNGVVDAVPPGVPGFAAQTAGGGVVAGRPGHGPLAGQVREVFLRLLALLGRQFGEEVDQHRDAFGAVGVGQGHGGAEADGRLGVLEEDADGGDLFRAADATEGGGGGGPANRRLVGQGADEGGLGLAVPEGDGGQGGLDFLLDLVVFREGQVIQQGFGRAGRLERRDGADDGHRQAGALGAFDVLEALPRPAGVVGVVEVVGGLAQDGHGRLAEGGQLRGRRLARRPARDRRVV